MKRRWGAILGAAVMGLTLAACGSAVAPTTTTTTAVTTTTLATVASCTSSQLTLTSSSMGGVGHIGVTVVFTNRSRTTCSLYGYPGVAALNAAGQQVVQAVRTTSGYLGGVASGATAPIVDLQPGQSASATVEGTDVPVGSATSCPTYPRLLVTPPNTTVSTTVTASLPGCSPVQVHPVVPGTSGYYDPTS